LLPRHLLCPHHERYRQVLPGMGSVIRKE
jgi:hypothetical protein